jgi:hypothetical protein
LAGQTSKLDKRSNLAPAAFFPRPARIPACVALLLRGPARAFTGISKEGSHAMEN